MNFNDSQVNHLNELIQLRTSTLKLAAEMENLTNALESLKAAVKNFKGQVQEAAELNQLQAEFQEVVKLRQLEAEFREAVAKYNLN